MTAVGSWGTRNLINEKFEMFTSAVQYPVMTQTRGFFMILNIEQAFALHKKHSMLVKDIRGPQRDGRIALRTCVAAG